MGRTKTIEELQARCKELEQEMRENTKRVHIETGNVGYDVTFDSRKEQICDQCGRTVYVAHTQNNKLMTVTQDGGQWVAHFPICKVKPDQMTLDQGKAQEGKQVVAGKLLERISRAEQVLSDERYKNHPKFDDWLDEYNKLVDQWEELTGNQYGGRNGKES